MALALVAGLAATWPPLHLVIVNANWATYYQENIGWRFFWVQRFIEHVPGDFVHPGQGVLIPLIQSVFYLLAKKALRLDLFGQINLFGHLTTAVAAIALLAIGLLIAFDRKLDATVRAALVVTPLVMGLGGLQLFSYDVYPDYLAYSKVFFLLFGWRWLHHHAWNRTVSSRGAVELGVLAGLLSMLKLNYAIWPAALLAVSLIAAAKNQPFAKVWRVGLFMALGAATSMAVLLLIFYHGNVYEVGEYFWYLFHWASSLQGSLTFQTDPFSAGETSLARLIAILGVLCFLRLVTMGVFYFLRTAPFWIKSASLVCAVIAIVSIAVEMCYLRSGGSSYFDAVVMACVLCPVVAATFEARSFRRVASLGVAAVFLVWPLSWAFANWNDYMSVTVNGHKPLTRLGEAGDWQRGLYNWNMSHGLPVYVLSPTQYENQGTIEDMLYMGFQNFGGAMPGPFVATIYPQIHYRYYDYQDPLVPDNSYHLTLPPEHLVFMYVTGKPPPDFPQLDPKALDAHEQQVARLLRDRRQEECYTVKQFMTGMDIVSCVLSAPK